MGAAPCFFPPGQIQWRKGKGVEGDTEMRKARAKKIFVISVCMLLVISAGVLFGYEKHRVKPLFSILHLSSDDITSAELR